MVNPHVSVFLSYLNSSMRKLTLKTGLIVGLLILTLFVVLTCKDNKNIDLYDKYNKLDDFNIRIDLNYWINWTGDVQTLEFTSIVPSTIEDRQIVKRILYSLEPDSSFSDNSNYYSVFKIKASNIKDKYYLLKIHCYLDTSNLKKKIDESYYRDSTMSERYIESDNTSIVSISTSLKTEDSIHTVDNIVSYIRNNIEYEPVDTFNGALDSLEKKKGDCIDYSSLFSALARAANIKTISVYGIYAKKDKFNGYLHAWNEAFLPEHGWTIIDATADKPITFNNDKSYIALSNLLADKNLNYGSIYKCQYYSNTPATINVNFKPTIYVKE